ncbi:MAG: acyl-CoA dehydrogenase [Oceanobacter sp.]
MIEYKAPVKDMMFLMESIQQQTSLLDNPAFEDYTPDLVGQILEEAGKFATGVLSPICQQGDEQGCKLEDGKVITPDGWLDAYQQFCDNGWMGLAMPMDFGGQGLPRFISSSVNEMWLASNLPFILFHALHQGASEILEHFGTDEQKAKYLEPIVTGQWSVTMALTEPNAGSDLANTRTKATPQGDGTYKIQGQKIFITFGDHEMAENIVHLVLARTPDAPAGSRGISLFAVPKFRINADGSLGEPNDVICSGLEHKMGMHGSPTCSMNYGDNDDCYGELIGEENKGLMAMFVLMNEARLSTGMQGVAAGQVSYQRSLQYAIERTQGAHYASGERVSIVEHPDVQRMLLSIYSQTMGMRALGMLIAALIDLGDHSEDKDAAKAAKARVALLTPIFKAYATEQGNLMTGQCIQIYGGMGFVEETGVAQMARDIRITTIYEGTTGIQARDLVFRKILMDQGGALQSLLTEVRAEADQLAASSNPALVALSSGLIKALDSTSSAIDQLLTDKDNLLRLHAGSVPLLDALGTLLTGWQLAVSAGKANAKVEQGDDPVYHGNQIALASFYFAHQMPKVAALFESAAQAEQGLAAFSFQD